MSKNISDGSASAYYNIAPKKDGFVDVDKIAEHLNLTFAEGNCLKALFGIAIARQTGKTRHDGTGAKRDLNKLKHYVELIKYD